MFAPALSRATTTGNCTSLLIPNEQSQSFVTQSHKHVALFPDV
jgi:hypothetical protein